MSSKLTSKVAVLAAIVTGTLMSFAVGASAAAAHSLVLKAEGLVVPLHSVSFVEMTINVKGNPSNCDFGEYNGRLESNSAPIDQITNTKPGVELNHCSAGASIAGNITEARITSKGKLTISASPKLALTIPGGAGSCTYEMSKLKAKFNVPTGEAFSPSETGKAKRSATSPASCAKSVEIEGGVAVGLNEPPRFDDFELEAI